MTKRKPKPDTSPVFLPERVAARAAAAALRGAIADPTIMGKPQTLHIDYSRPRRGEWVTTWPGVPGLRRASDGKGTRYSHDLLPGWEYRRDEIVREMIPDLETMAEQGIRPAEATR